VSRHLSWPVSKRLAQLALMGAALPVACTVGPNYRAPEPGVPPQFTAAALLPGGQTTGTPQALTAWWDQFHDSQLNALIAQALKGNLDLQTAASRVRVARDQLIIADAARLPSVGADADVSALHLSQNSGLSEFTSLFGGGGGSGSANGLTLPGNNITTYTIGFDASWEIDLFGGVRRSVQAAQAVTEQAVWSQRDSEVSIAAEVANDYWLLRSLQGEIAVANDEVQQQTEMLSLLRARRQFGFVTDQDVRSQAAQLAQAKAALPDLESARQAQIHALGVLAGEAPEAMETQLSAAQALPAAPTQIPVGLPSDLLRRRPDVRAAERALAASSARIGVAVDALYPKLNLTGALDLVSLDLKHLLDIASRQYNATGALNWPLFQGGRGRANVRLAEEQNRQALYAYQSTILVALQEVEDALTRYGGEQKKNAALHDALSEAQAAEQIARRQFQIGLENIGPVLGAEAAVLQARMQLAQSDGALASDLVSLYKALGGGWGDT
jgi:NodT family efflux transporter outer membrane factor (OMF) lipoprotein